MDERSGFQILGIPGGETRGARGCCGTRGKAAFPGIGNGSKTGIGPGIRPRIPGKSLGPAARFGSQIPLENGFLLGGFGRGEKEKNPPGIRLVSKENREFGRSRVGNGRKRAREEVGKIPGVLLGKVEADQESLERLDSGIGRFSLKKNKNTKKSGKRRWEQEFHAKEKLRDNPGREFVWIRE